MGRLKYGINGPVSGKVGSVVGATWRDIAYIRALPAKPAKRTSGQLANQSRFATVNKWLAPFKPFTSIGLMYYSGRMTAYNAAYNLNHRLVPLQDDADAVIDYASLILSDGDLLGADEPAVQVSNTGIAEISWKARYNHRAKASDELMVLLYLPEQHDSIFTIGRATRGDLHYTLIYDDKLRGHHSELFISFASADRKRVSRSQYLGSVTL